MRWAVVLLVAGCGRVGFAPGTNVGDTDGNLSGDSALLDAAETQRFISPTGDDANDGSRAAPWRNFDYAYSQTADGKVLVLLSGEYTALTSGPFGVACNSEALKQARVIRADVQRGARVIGNQQFTNCGEWDINGIEFIGSGGAPVLDVVTSPSFTLRNAVVRFPSIVELPLLRTNSANTSVIDSEFYDFGSIGIAATDTATSLAVRGTYINSRRTPSGDVAQTGLLVQGADALIESTIIEETTYGIRLFADRLPLSNTRVINTVSINRGTGLESFPVVAIPQGTVIENFVTIGSTVGIVNSGSRTTVRRASVFGTANYTTDGFVTTGGSPELTVRDTYIAGAGTGIRSNTGVTTFETLWLTGVPTPLNPGNTPGTGLMMYAESSRCRLRAPAGSMRRNQMVGADIAFRTVDGVDTNEPFFHPTTGQFRCGAIIPGINDTDASCTRVHLRLGGDDPACH